MIPRPLREAKRMEIKILITSERIIPDRESLKRFSGQAGAVAEFSGTVRDLEGGQPIPALEYEAYSPMAENEIRRILESLAETFPCLAARVIHRIGVIPVGETAIYVGIFSKHRAEAFAMLTGFMDRLKQDVPIWKSRALPVGDEVTRLKSTTPSQPRPGKRVVSNRSLDEALAEIGSLCQPLPGVRVPLAEAFGRTLLETVLADQNLPASDKSTRDGYAVLQDDLSE